MTATPQAIPPEGTVAGPIRLNSDPIDWPRTPGPVADKLRHLRRERNEARLVWRAAADERQEAWDNRQAAEARLRQLTGGRANSPFFDPIPHADYHRLEDDHPEVASSASQIGNGEGRYRRLRPILDARAHRQDQTSRLVSQIERYLTEGLRGCGDGTLQGSQADPAEGRNLSLMQSSAVAAAFANWMRIVIGLHPPHGTPPKPSGAHARKSKSSLSAGGQVLCRSSRTQDGSIAWAGRSFTDHVIGGRLITAVGEPSALPLLFWLHREAIVSKIEQQIDEIADDPSALTARSEPSKSAKSTEIDSPFNVTKNIGLAWQLKTVRTFSVVPMPIRVPYSGLLTICLPPMNT